MRCFVDTDYQFDIADCAARALSILEEKGPFDMIIADFLMPGDDGCELLKKVQGKWPNMSRILFTASIDNCRVQASLNNGTAEALIQKPWDQKDIFSVMSSV